MRQLYFFHDQAKTYIPIHDGLVIGRSKGDLHFKDDPLVSRQHCKFTISHGDVFVEDLGSTNPTRVNRVPLTPKRRRKLLINDVIKVGEQRLILTAQTQTTPTGTQDSTVFLAAPVDNGPPSTVSETSEPMTFMIENPEIHRRPSASWKPGAFEVRGMPAPTRSFSPLQILLHPIFLTCALGLTLWLLANS